MSAPQQALVDDGQFGHRLSENGSFDIATLADMYKRPIEIYECEAMGLSIQSSKDELETDSIEPVTVRPKNIDKKANPEPIRLSAHPGNYFHSLRPLNRQATAVTGRKVRVSLPLNCIAIK